MARKTAVEEPLEERVAGGDLVFESEATREHDAGPEAAAKAVAAIVLGEDPQHDPGNMAVEVERRLLAEGKNECRLFKFSAPDDCKGYAELLDKEQLGMVRRVGVKEMVSGTDYALFINWVVFNKPEPMLREKIEAEIGKKAKALIKKASKKPVEPPPPSATDEPVVLPEDPICRANKANGERCRRKRVSGSMFCRHHDMKDTPVMDRPPPTHSGLAS